MSNTATVSPYDGDSSAVCAATGAVVVGVIALPIAVAAFLMEKSSGDENALEQLREERRNELLAASKPMAMKLHVKDTQSILLAAKRLGYSVEKTSRPMVSDSRSSYLLLHDNTGRKLALQTTYSGIVVASNEGAKAIRDVVRQHTLQRALDHLKSRYSGVKTRQLANGVVEIEARELDVSHVGGSATLNAKIKLDGAADIDISDVKGPGCEKILAEFAEAVGGEPTRIEKKSSFFELPGETAKTRIKI